jgi:hypothetical protein
MKEIAADAPQRKAVETILQRPYVQWVLGLGAESRLLARRRCTEQKKTDCVDEHPAFLVIKPGGNHPRQGLALQRNDAISRFPSAYYAEIDPRSADLLIPHEYGHTIMFRLLSDEISGYPMALPHTTSAITDDMVALTEGWGIHLETLAADRPETEGIYESRHRDRFVTEGSFVGGDSLLEVVDLLSFSQSHKRYQCIKDGCFAYLPRESTSLQAAQVKVEDLLARHTDATYDPARLRNLAQMCASEGLVATLFYRLATAGGESGHAPSMQRYRAMLTAFARLNKATVGQKPIVLAFLEQLMLLANGAERERIARVALEVFHYAPMEPDAAAINARLHALGHQVDRKVLLSEVQKLAAKRERMHAQLVADPSLIARLAPPRIGLRNEQFRLSLPMLGISGRPLIFDLNTAPLAVLLTIPGLDYAAATKLQNARSDRGGFRSVEEVAAIVGEKVAAAIVAMQRSYDEANSR